MSEAPDRAIRQHCLNPTKWRIERAGTGGTTALLIHEPDLYRLMIRGGKP